ncbi:MAG: hypothetical protein K1X67_16055 [Fimbriimonadaceae bacterium]|nr:hypothetical protein [Fimbriimonadaceae bacterium]
MAVATRESFACEAYYRECSGRASGRLVLLWLINFALASVLSAPSQASAQADAPPRDYLDLGPHFVFAPGFGSTTEFRDLLLQKAASLRVTGTATYRGWSLSGTLDQSIESTRTRASELLATYSHKLPYADLHLGIVYAQIDGGFSGECTAASATVSSNSLPSTKLDLTVQNDLSGTCRLISIGASQVLWRRGAHQFELRASATNWETDILKTDGWSVRLMGRSQLGANKSVHYHIGYVDSNLRQGAVQREPSGITMGVNYVWEFR